MWCEANRIVHLHLKTSFHGAFLFGFCDAHFIDVQPIVEYHVGIANILRGFG